MYHNLQLVASSFHTFEVGRLPEIRVSTQKPLHSQIHEFTYQISKIKLLTEIEKLTDMKRFQLFISLSFISYDTLSKSF